MISVIFRLAVGFSILAGSNALLAGVSFSGTIANQEGTLQVRTDHTGKVTILRPTEMEMKVLLEKATAGDDYSQMLVSQVHYAEKNFAEGEQWLRKAARVGNIFAEQTLGGELVFGYRGGPTQVDEGVTWLKLAAYEGSPGAQHELALCYKKGLGVAKNLQEAYTWLLISQRSYPFPDQAATNMLVSMEKELSTAQIQESRARVKQFAPSVMNRNAIVDYGFLKLKAVSESKGSPIVVINDQAFSTGEEKGVSDGLGRRIAVRCLEIRKNSAVIATEPYWQRAELRM